ncbi:MAG TPA: hypothetical protein VH393_06130 [Ktedonobacterales bacterium]|jgi:hypothetical protein
MRRPSSLLTKFRMFAQARRDSFALVLVLILLQIPTYITDIGLTVRDVLRESGLLTDQSADYVSGGTESGGEWVAAVIIALVIVLFVFRLTTWLRRLTFLVAILQTLDIVVVTLTLVATLNLPAQTGWRLLQDSLVVWLSVVLLFTLWYWLLDEARGSAKEQTNAQRDILFAEAGVSTPEQTEWHPRVLDYAYVAFTISTTFSPGSTLMFSRRAKALQMLHTTLTLLLFLVIAARAINILK